MEDKDETNSQSRNLLIGKVLWTLAILNIIIFGFTFSSAKDNVFHEMEALEIIAKAIYFGLIFLACAISGTLFILKR